VRVNIYINNQRLDLFDDETIMLNQSVKDLKDLTKVFNDFSNNFTVPATPNNNNIFKHYYDVDIDGGFDARVKQSARIDLDGFDFREGKIQLTSVNHKKGLPVNYKIQYFSNLTSLKDLFGDDKLGDIGYFENYDHPYTDENVALGFSVGLPLNGDSDAIVYPLMSYNRRFIYNSTPAVDGAVDIAVDKDGVDWTELLPAIRCSSIIKSISEHYALTFSNEFFSTLDFQFLYMSLIASDQSIIGGKEQEIAFFPDAPFSSVVSFISRIRIRTFVETGFETIPYNVRLYKNDELIFDVDAVGNFSNGDGTILPSPVTETADLSLRIFTQEPLNFDSTEARYRVIQFPAGTTIYQAEDNRTNVVVGDFTVKVRELMPDLKVIDWFNAIKQAFNLVIVPTGENEFYVNDLNSWYVEGKIHDISEFVDTEVKETQRGKLYRRVDMRYAENESFLAYFFNEQNKRQFGSLQEDILINGQKIDGDVLDVTLPFEKPVFERLSNIDAGGFTDIMFGFITDKSQENYNNKPILLYAPRFVRPDGTGIKFNKASTPTNFFANRTPSSRRLVNEQSFAVNFGSELNEYDGITNPQSFYNTYWRDYINDTMSIKRREINIKVKLSQDLIFKIQPNDRLVINGIRYIINTNKLNLLTGQTSLSLFNDIFEFALPTDVTGTRIEPNEILIDHKAQDIQVTVFSNEEVDNIVAGETWQEFDQFDFLPNTPFTIGITENTGANRQGIVTFTFPSGDYILTIGQLEDES
jgi:hypothetical protein